MSQFVAGHQPPLRLGEQTAALLDARHDALDGQREVLQRHGRSPQPGGGQRGFVHHVGQIGPGQPDGDASHLVQVGLRRQDDLSRMHPQDGQSAGPVGPVHQHLAIEAAGAQQRRVQHLGPVRGRQQHHAHAGIEAVQL